MSDATIASTDPGSVAKEKLAFDFFLNRLHQMRDIENFRERELHSMCVMNARYPGMRNTLCKSVYRNIVPMLGDGNRAGDKIRHWEHFRDIRLRRERMIRKRREERTYDNRHDNR